MKLITSVSGSTILHATSDDVLPKKGVLQRDIVRIVGNSYQFQVKPNIAEGMPAEMMPVLTFQSGTFDGNGDSYPVQQISMMIGGDVISAATTDIADIVLDDFMDRLSDGLGFRYGAHKWKRTYFSSVVVEFDPAIEERVKVFGQIEKILNKELPREHKPFKPKTIAFGHGNPVSQIGLTIESIEGADFSIQRRVGDAYSTNRYFCTAPTSTEHHLKIIEQVEKALGG